MDKTTETQQTNNIFKKEVGNISVELVYADGQSTVSVWYQKELIYHNFKMREEFPFEELLKKMDVISIKIYRDSFYDDVEKYSKGSVDLSELNTKIIAIAFCRIINRLDSMISQENEGKATNQSNTTPQFIQEMIDEGLLFPDGKRVVSSLEKITSYLIERKGMSCSEMYIKELFKKPDGEDYSTSAIRSSISYANDKTVSQKK